MMPLSLEEFMMWLKIHRLKLETGRHARCSYELDDSASSESEDCLCYNSKPDALVNLVTQLAANQKPASVARVCGIRSSNDHHTSVCPSSQQSGVDEHPQAFAANTYSRPPQHNLEGMSIMRLRRQTPIANHHSSRDKALDRENGFQLLARKVKLDALVNLVTQLAANQKLASVARTSVLPMTTILVSVLLHSNLEWMNILRLMLQTPIADHLSSSHKALDREDGSILLALRIRSLPLLQESAASILPITNILVFILLRSNLEWMGILRHAAKPIADHHNSRDKALDREDGCQLLALRIRSLPLLQGSATSVLSMTTILVFDVLRSNLELMSILRLMLQTPIPDHHNTSTETRKLEGKLDSLVNFVTQLAANQKHASVARVCDICSSNDHHTNVNPSSQQYGFSARNDAIVIRGVHDVATNTSTESTKLEGKLDSLVNLVTQLAVNQKPASVARVCDIHSSNDHHTSLCPSSQQSRFSARNDVIVIKGVHDVATDTSAETRKLEGKLDALVNLVTQLVANQKPTSVARICDIRSFDDHHTSFSPSSKEFRVDEHHEAYFRERNYAIVIGGVLDVAIYTSAETRKLEGKLDTLVNLVTQLAANQKPASVARVCDIRSFNDHHTSVCPSSQQSGVDEHPEAYTVNTYGRPPQGVHDMGTDTSTETRKLEGKLESLINFVTQLATNQKPASVAGVCDIRSSNDHHTSICLSSQQSGLSARNDAIVIRGVHDVATDTSVETRKLEGNLDALVNLVTQLAANQNPTSVAMTTILVSISARNDVIVIGGVHDVAIDTSVETRKLEGNLDSLVNLVTQLAANQKHTSFSRVSGIRSSNDHHTSVCPSSQQSGVDEHPEAYAANTYSRPPQGVHDVAIDTSAETRKLVGKLDALVNLVTLLVANQKPASVARVCGIRSSNDHHTSVCPSSQQSGADEHPEAYAANTYRRPPQQ
ncbi:hypothetical protein Fmac_032791 [Flemingia macrophylla]|uniref:Uncharacterized protein n=1 Tax=Flemingia macrophylla TaxID=520843 RepID=A0ABD1L5X7_9FABA